MYLKILLLSLLSDYQTKWWKVGNIQNLFALGVRLLKPVVVALISILPLTAKFSLAGPMIVVDTDDNRIVFQQQIDRKWYPASLVKLMTTYIALEAVEKGEITYNTKLSTSALAVQQIPARIGLTTNMQMTLGDTLKLMLLSSANDLAVMIAEGITGSTPGFVERMNHTAKELGLTSTRFTNVGGKPDPEQYSTARDIAKLAYAIIKKFPKEISMFNTKNMRIHSKIYYNTNNLLWDYPWAQGMKTGYTCGAGFNLVALASRSGHNLLVVVLGAEMAGLRVVYAEDLLEHQFHLMETGLYRAELNPVLIGSHPGLVLSFLQPFDMSGIVCDEDHYLDLRNKGRYQHLDNNRIWNDIISGDFGFWYNSWMGPSPIQIARAMIVEKMRITHSDEIKEAKVILKRQTAKGKRELAWLVKQGRPYLVEKRHIEIMNRRKTSAPVDASPIPTMVGNEEVGDRSQ